MAPRRIAFVYVPGIEHHVQESLIEAFRRLGHIVRVWRLPSIGEFEREKRPAPGSPEIVRRWDRWLAGIRAFRPDFGFSIDVFPLFWEPPRPARPTSGQARPNAPLPQLFAAAGVPLGILWTAEPVRMLLTYESDPPLSMSRSRVVHFVPDTVAVTELRRFGLRARYLPLATSMHEARAAAPSRARAHAEVAFVGHAADRAPRFAALRAHFGGWALALLRAAARRPAAAAHPARALAEAIAGLSLADQGSARAALAHPRVVGYFLREFYGAVSVPRRWGIISGLGRPVQVHGFTLDWPRRRNVVRRPPLDYIDELPAHYRDTLINLNVTGAQFAHGVNQRVFDVPAAGGFLLTDRRKDLARHFAIGREAIVYDDLADLRRKIRWYLDRPWERRRVIDRARRRIEGEHRWTHRAGAIVRELG